MSKKDARQEAIKKGLKRLAEWGVDTENVSAAAAGPLIGHLGKGHDSDLAVVYLLGRVADPAALEALMSLEKSASAKELKREARRSLFKLAQKGLSVPRAEKIAAERPVLKVGPGIEAYVSSVDGAGGRLVWLARAQAGSGLQLLQGILSDREGLMQTGGALVKRKELRRMAEEIKEHHGITMVSVPWEYADQILYQGYEKAKARGRGGLENFPSLHAVFNPVKPKDSPHPIYDRLSSESVRSDDWREISRRLLDELELHAWILDEDWMKSYLERAEEAEESRLVLNPLQKEERLASIVREAVRELFSGEAGGIFRRRMEDMAFYFSQTKRPRQAELALAVALQLAEGDPGVLDVSFLTGLVQKSLAFYFSQAKEKAKEEPSLIVKP